MASLVAVDVGGTFTDLVVLSQGGLTSRKVPTTRDQSDGVSGAIGELDGLFLHGTTAATNTLLEERGARVALITDAGYEDLIEIARQDRPSLYDPAIDRPAPLVPREMRHSDPGSMGPADIVAVSLLGSYLDPAEEEAMADRISLPTVLSSRISPEFREYERLATTVLSAYLTPSVADYLGKLDSRLTFDSRLVMTSSGGLIPFGEAAGLAGRLVLSGPAGGAVAAAAVGSHHGFDSVIAFDMGGTSTDVCRITGGAPSVGTGHLVAGRVNRVPSIPIRTIGAGGGSIAWVDDGGALRVGPRSAGADPGPAVYGLGGSEFTVTDANVLAGHIPADLALGGTVRLDADSGRAAAERLASSAGLPVGRAVDGVLEVVDAHMERALRAVSVEEGANPRESALVAFGGAGGLHAVRLARSLGMRTVLIPPLSGVFSALGLLLATPRADASRTVMLAAEDDRLPALGAEIENESLLRYRDMFGNEAVVHAISADVRYVGQSHELEVAVSEGWGLVAATFHRAHHDRFGFDRSVEPVEVVNIRAVASGTPPLAWDDLPRLDGGLTPARRGAAWERSSLPPGFEIRGPSLVVEDNSAILLEEADRMTVQSDGTLRIDL